MMRWQKKYGFRFIYLYFASEESRKRIHLARANERQRILREITSFFAFCEGMGSRAEQNFWTDCHWRMSCGCPKWIRFSKSSIVRWLRRRDAPPCDPKYLDLFKNAVPWIWMKKKIIKTSEFRSSGVWNSQKRSYLKRYSVNLLRWSF